MNGDPPTVAETQRPIPKEVGSIAASRDVHGPFIRDDSLRLDSVHLSSTSALPTTFTFQVFAYLKGTRRYLAPPVATTGLVVAAGAVFRLHAKDRLMYDIPPGSLLGVTVTRASGTLVNPTFHFNLVGG